jgi:tetratricopeptide (TPR) repeat protein
VDTLHYMEWRSFIQSHWSGAGESLNSEGFIGRVPGIGVMIALGKLVSKDELDQIRNAFPTTINRTSPSNSPVKIVAWVLDVPAQRIQEAAGEKKLPVLADEIEDWAFKVATVVDDLAQSFVLAHEEGEWDLALKRIRQALQKPGARNNSYIRRMAADCSLALGDWPGALKYAQEAVALSGRELGSGLVRSLCMEADAHLCLGNPVHAWDLYSEAAAKSPSHPLPRYYRGQALLLMAKLLRVYEGECHRTGELETLQMKRIDVVVNVLASGAIEDLTSAADLLDRWGLIPESYQYRNFHLVPTLIGQGLSYLLTRSPGPAASRLQSARHSFPKDDLFLREYLFAKCWEQGVQRQYAVILLGNEWGPFHTRLEKTFGRSS